jgi:hypothetical protein
MTVPANTNPLLLNSAAPVGYQISRSLRFNGSVDSAYLNRTPGSAGDRNKWTFSCWVKLGAGLANNIFSVFTANSGNTGLIIRSGSVGSPYQIEFFTQSGATVPLDLITTRVFRDYGAWFHLLFYFDLANSTQADRAQIYINGVRETNFSTNTNTISTSSVGRDINNTSEHRIGAGNGYADGYLADVHFCDGYAYDPSYFTETDAITGQLIPKAFTGSYGTNGFKLNFSNNATTAALGTDTSGNGNTWTVNNLSIITGGPTSVASASGALPIYNTTDTYGTTKGAGTRTDTSSASIVLAVAMDGANNGTTFTDESATIKGSGSAKSLTRTGTITSTAQSKFYGSSGYFDGASRLTVDLSSVSVSSAYTVEFWWYKAGTQSGNHGHFCLNGANNQTIAYREAAATGTGSNDFYVDLGGTFVPGLITQTINTGSWNHFAFVHEGGGVFKSYLNGVLQTTKTVGTTGTMGSTTSIGGGIGSYTGQFINGYVSDYRIYQNTKYTGGFNPPSSTQNPTIAAGNDSLVDSPTGYGTDTGAGGEVRGNYATLNPLNIQVGAGSLSNGNLDFTGPSGSSAYNFVGGTFGIDTSTSTGWYFEVTQATYGQFAAVSLLDQGVFASSLNNLYVIGNSFANQTAGISYSNVGSVSNYGTVTTGLTSWTSNGDVIGVAIKDNKIWFAKNNTWISGSPSAGTSPSITLASTKYVTPALIGINSSVLSLNAGQRPFAYTAPSGYKALCSHNLPEPTILQGNTAMDVKLYTGNGSSRSITGLAFSPDLVWIKGRSIAADHGLFDIVRGTTKRLVSNATQAEDTQSGVTAFNSNGFDLGSYAGQNNNNDTYAAWTWDCGSSTVTNTSGSISSQVRASATNGCSVVTWSTNSSSGNATIGHGLNAQPKLIIMKSRNATYNWDIYHGGISNAKDGRLTFTTAAFTTAQVPFGGVDSTSTVFTMSQSFYGSGIDCVAYCFAPVAGFSAFGSYTGNGSTDGPFVFTGHRSRWIMLKRTDTSADWYIFDTARNTYNALTSGLFPNASDAEATNSLYGQDFLSNGWKIRSSQTQFNASGGTYVYASFAEAPVKYSRAR